MKHTSTPVLHGLLAEYTSPDALLAAAKQAKERGYARMDAYTPFPVHGLDEAIGFKKSRLSAVVLMGGIAGGLLGYGLQYYTTVIAYPMNIGGKPLHSWPAFIPVTFEMTILFAALGAALGMLLLNGLPQPHHPVFNAPNFQLASRDRFFLCIEQIDPIFNESKTKKFLESTKPVSVTAVEDDE